MIKKNNKIKHIIPTVAITTYLSQLCVLADNNSSGGSGTASKAVQRISGFCGTICNILFYVGAVVLVWGFGTLILSFKNEDADSKVKATMMIVAACILLSIKFILNQIFPGIL